MKPQKFLIIKTILFSIFYLLLLSFPAFSEETLSEGENIQEQNYDFMFNKKFNIEFGLSGFMLQVKTNYFLNDDIYPFIRFAGGGVGSRQTQYLSALGFDAETGIKYNFYRIKNNKKTFLNNFYAKVFAGGTKTATPQFNLFPFAGVGLGFSTIVKSFEFSIGFDLGSSFEYFPGSGFGGVIFIRPEFNFGTVF